jgi:methyl-accepting chemotaxis protein
LTVCPPPTSNRCTRYSACCPHSDIVNIIEGIAFQTNILARNAAMNQLVNSVERVTATMKRIAAATSEQSEAIAQVSQVVAGLDKATRQNASNVQRTAGAAGAVEGDAGRRVNAVCVFQTRDGTDSDRAWIGLSVAVG